MKTIPYGKFKHGQRVTCEVMGNTINGKIAIGNKYVYLCSDCEELDSEELSNFGYKFSWSFLAIGDTYDSDKNTITNLKFLPNTITKHDLKEESYTIKQEAEEQEITELTLADVAKLANVSVEKLRIKD